MSGPDTSYDPVEVAVLQPAEIARMQAEALAAIAAAASLDALREAKVAHAGDREHLRVYVPAISPRQVPVL